MFNPFSLKDKNVVITGASSGIGRKCAISCSQMGATVILLGRNKQRLSETFSLLNNGEHLSYSIDLTEYEQIESVISDVIQKVGRIDGFIHAAGIEKTIPLKMMKASIYKDLFEINFVSGFELAKLLSKKKYCNNTGSFVFISSIMSIAGNAGLTGYCASKGALVSGTRAMAVELAPKKIRVNCVSPSHLEDTEMSNAKNENIGAEALTKLIEMHPLGLGSKIDVANACIYLLSDASKWVTGTNLIVDGGYSAK